MREIYASVVIPVYNRPDTLDKCLDALTAQKTGFSFVYTDSWPTNSTLVNDTLWVSRSESRFDCHAAPDGPSVYVGIAMIEDGKFKKGWIRFRLEGPAKINFEEMAFQR